MGVRNRSRRRGPTQEGPLELRALTVGQECFFAIEAFSEDGVSPISRVVRPP